MTNSMHWAPACPVLPSLAQSCLPSRGANNEFARVEWWTTAFRTANPSDRAGTFCWPQHASGGQGYCLADCVITYVEFCPPVMSHAGRCLRIPAVKSWANPSPYRRQRQCRYSCSRGALAQQDLTHASLQWCRLQKPP